MCRGFQQNERDRLLKIKAFYLRLSVSSNGHHPLPDSLTLHYLPRINCSPLEINESSIRPDSPAFVTLHRVLSGEKVKGSVFYGSRERVNVSEGVKFEVYLREEKAVKGIFRKDEGDEWKMECKCGLEGERAALEVVAAEVVVAADGGIAMREVVEMVVRRKRRGRCFERLEEIPEQREGEEVEEGCCCCCNGGDAVEDGGDEEEMAVAEVEGVGWAVDVGIWVMCLGVGYLVSKASAKSLRRRRVF